jgi:hypothetical protein
MLIGEPMDNRPIFEEGHMVGEEIGEMEVSEHQYVGEDMMRMEEQIREEIDRDVVRQLREVVREHYPEDSISETMPMRA